MDEQSKDVKPIHFDNTRNMRWGEIGLVGEKEITMWNSTGLGDVPPNLWDALNAQSIKEQFKVRAAVINGPHWWAFDESTLYLGDEIAVGGMRFRYVSSIPASMAAKEGPPLYEVFISKKQASLLYAKGKPVYELVSPEGDVYVMQTAAGGPAETTLPERLKPAKGWTSRVRTLDKDLTLELNGDIRTVLDDIRNNYNSAANCK